MKGFIKEKNDFLLQNQVNFVYNIHYIIMRANRIMSFERKSGLEIEKKFESSFQFPILPQKKLHFYPVKFLRTKLS